MICEAILEGCFTWSIGRMKHIFEELWNSSVFPNHALGTGTNKEYYFQPNPTQMEPQMFSSECSINQSINHIAV